MGLLLRGKRRRVGEGIFIYGARGEGRADNVRLCPGQVPLSHGVTSRSHQGNEGRRAVRLYEYHRYTSVNEREDILAGTAQPQSSYPKRTCRAKAPESLVSGCRARPMPVMAWKRVADDSRPDCGCRRANTRIPDPQRQKDRASSANTRITPPIGRPRAEVGRHELWSVLPIVSLGRLQTAFGGLTRWGWGP